MLRTFLQDRFNQLTLGIFVATFAFAMVVLRSVRGGEEGETFVPQLGVAVAFLLVLASVVVFLFYIHHMAQSIRAATIVALIGNDTRDLIECRHPRTPDELDTAPHTASDGQVGPTRLVAATQSGIVVTIDDAKLARLAQHSGSTVYLLRAIGEFVPVGAALLASTASTLPRTSNCVRESSSLRNAPSTRTSASACASSSTSPTGRCPRE